MAQIVLPEPHQRAFGFILGALLRGFGLRNERFRNLGLWPQPPRRLDDRAPSISLIYQATGSWVAKSQRRLQQGRPKASRRATGVALESAQQPEPLRLMTGLNHNRIDPRPVLFKVFAEHLCLLIEQIGNEQAKEI